MPSFYTLLMKLRGYRSHKETYTQVEFYKPGDYRYDYARPVMKLTPDFVNTGWGGAYPVNVCFEDLEELLKDVGQELSQSPYADMDRGDFFIKGEKEIAKFVCALYVLGGQWRDQNSNKNYHWRTLNDSYAPYFDGNPAEPQKIISTIMDDNGSSELQEYTQNLMRKLMARVQTKEWQEGHPQLEEDEIFLPPETDKPHKTSNQEGIFQSLKKGITGLGKASKKKQEEVHQEQPIAKEIRAIKPPIHGKEESIEPVISSSAKTVPQWMHQVKDVKELYTMTLEGSGNKFNEDTFKKALEESGVKNITVSKDRNYPEYTVEYGEKLLSPSSTNTLTMDVKNSIIKSNDLSATGFKLIANVAKASGADGVDISQVIAQIKSKPNHQLALESVLANAYRATKNAGLHLEGVPKGSFESAYIMSLQAAEIPLPKYNM